MRVRNKHSGLMATVDMTYHPAEYLGKHRVIYDDGSAWYMTQKQFDDTFEQPAITTHGYVHLGSDGKVSGYGIASSLQRYVDALGLPPTKTDLAPESYVEADRYGIDQHSPGAKLDAGKNRMSLVMGGFAKALQSVGEVGTFGANKYTDNGWKSVPNAKERYTDAMLRHYFKEQAGELYDPETNIYHAAHLAWNALARLEKLIEEDSIEQSNSNTVEQRRVSDNEEDLRANPFYTGGWHSAID